MYRSHGDATRLDVSDIDYEALDSALEAAGEDPAAVRLGLVNDSLGPGRFGRMFGDLDKFRPPDEGLEELSRSMVDEVPQDPGGDADVPAGLTYLGQFIDHDITGDKTTAFALRGIRGTSTPYSLPVALALLKLPTGAVTAIVGLVLMRGEFVPGLSALETSAQILSWAMVFGYAQQLVTRLVDQQAHAVLDDVGGRGPAGDRPTGVGPTS